ncbi:MAG: AI-2E family transporter [Bacteroidota bacterium]
MRKAAYFCIVITTALFALIYGQSLMVPFITALLLWFLTYEIRKSLDKLAFFNRYLPNWLKNVAVFALMVFALSGIIDILATNISSLIASSSKYEANLQQTLESIKQTFNINFEESINELASNLDISAMLSNLVNSLSGFLGNMMMVLIYALFVFLEESSIKEKVSKAFQSQAQHDQFMQTITKIESSLFDYLRLKTLVSLMTGGLSYVVLMLVGLDSPMFWAFLIFLMNYIPTIGSLVATVFPALFSLVQFGTWTPFVLILLLVGVVQLIVGNIIEPRVMGKSLNVSPLVTIIALAVWGQIWGITGMILSVPITVMMIIILSQFQETKTLAILLTETGEIE